MKNTYELQGMSCGGCVSSVKNILLQIPDVTDADVQLHPPRAVLTMRRVVDIDELQAELNKVGSYIIKEVNESSSNLKGFIP